MKATATATLVAHVCPTCQKRYEAAVSAVVTCAHANTPRYAAKPAVAHKEQTAAMTTPHARIGEPLDLTVVDL